jgi:phosphoribosylglycinamide formyltransferase-1/phosphoribosylamine--glycine ligase/phosphoribosylglycinamide formyltransferase/phosphoribosylformylglycinamidine cyclo-ligase
MFAYFRHDHHGDGSTAICVKTSGREEQDMLIESDPDRYSWPAYIGPSGWIAIDLSADDPDWDHVGDRIAQSWELAAPRRLLEAGGR